MSNEKQAWMIQLELDVTEKTMKVVEKHLSYVEENLRIAEAKLTEAEMKNITLENNLRTQSIEFTIAKAKHKASERFYEGIREGSL